jgi:putative peptidoglycan lipid II flippase
VVFGNQPFSVYYNAYVCPSVAMLKEHVARWSNWRSASTNRRIFTAIMVVVATTIVTKLAVVAKELVIAAYFGTDEVVDAFLIALLLPMFAINILAGSFNSAMMPIYIQTRKNLGMVAAQRLFSSVLLLGILFLIAIAFSLAVLAPVSLPLLTSGFSEQTTIFTQTLFHWLLPVLVLTGIGRLYATGMNADEQFAIVALTPAITPICAIVALVLLTEQWGILALAGGTLLGAALELTILAMAASRWGNVPLLPRWSGITKEIRAVIGQFLPMAAGAFLMNSTALVDQAMAAMLEPGSVATLSYANKVVAMILGIGAIALGTAVLPHFSNMVADEDWIGVRHTFKTYARLVVFLSVPITVVLFLFSEPIINILFERGAFSSQDTRLVGQIQAVYVLQIPFYILGILTVRLISSMKANHILMWGAGISLPLNILLNYIFIQWIGISGIAVSTVCVYIVSFLYLAIMLAIKIRTEADDDRK